MQISTLIAPSVVKSTLARLLATENISVEHKDTPTAYFDLKNRVLALPRWKAMSGALYDMLVGHEVAHALWTPAGNWSSDTNMLAAKHGVSRGIAKQYLNIAEDARIEALIKAKFPGLRADFFRGYGELHAQNFFGFKSYEVAGMCVGDRVNLYSKIGLHVSVSIPFTAAEAVVRDAVCAAVTWAETVAGADAMLLLDRASSRSPSQELQDGKGKAVPVPQDGEGECGEGDQSTGGEAEEAEGNGVSEEKAGKSKGKATDNPAEAQIGGNSGGESQGKKAEIGVPRTQDALCEAMKQLNETSRNTPNTVSLRLDEPSLRVVVPFARILADIDEAMARNSISHYSISTEPVRITEHKTAATAMATAFDRRKAADTWKRTTIGKSGTCDPLRMTQYKWNEDIFRRTTRIAEGKNHGIVILLDWSGSMSGMMQETIGQLLIITDFCRTAAIPFEVYAFSDRQYLDYEESVYNNDGRDPKGRSFSESCAANRVEFNPQTAGTATVMHMRLLNFFSSLMTTQQYERMKSLMWNGWRTMGRLDSRLSLGGTPTTAALHHASAVIADFQRRNRVQITHTVVLTDGEPTDWYRAAKQDDNGNHYVMYDTVTGASYDIDRREVENDGSTEVICRGSVQPHGDPRYRGVWVAQDIIRRRTGAAVHWVGLTDRGTASRFAGFVADKHGNWSRDGFVRGTAVGWDTAVVASASRFSNKRNTNEQGTNPLVDRKVADGDRKIAAAKTQSQRLKAFTERTAATNSLRSLATIIGEFLAL